VKKMAVTHPKFLRNNANRKLRLKTGWRKPRGIDSKQRQKLKYAGPLPRIGWGGKKEEKNLHPTGKKVALVANEKELLAAPKGALLRLSAKLGAKKAVALAQIAQKNGYKILNPKREKKKKGKSKKGESTAKETTEKKGEKEKKIEVKKEEKKTPANESKK